MITSIVHEMAHFLRNASEGYFGRVLFFLAVGVIRGIIGEL